MITELEGPVDCIVFVGIDARSGCEVPPNGHPLSVSLEGIVLALVVLHLSWILILSTVCIDLHLHKMHFTTQHAYMYVYLSFQ